MFQTSKTLNGSNLFFFSLRFWSNCVPNVECAEWDGPLHSHNMGGKPQQAPRFPGAIPGDTCISACLCPYLTCSCWCSLSIVLYIIFQISRYLPGLGDYKMINNGKTLLRTFFFFDDFMAFGSSFTVLLHLTVATGVVMIKTLQGCGPIR